MVSGTFCPGVLGAKVSLVRIDHCLVYVKSSGEIDLVSFFSPSTSLSLSFRCVVTLSGPSRVVTGTPDTPLLVPRPPRRDTTHPHQSHSRWAG